MVNVFCDFHHGALYYSFALLFEKRLGWELFRPIGYEWHKRGFWAYSHNPRVVKQYLEPFGERFRDGVYHVPREEGTVEYVQKAITFEKFLEMDFDFAIASVNQHEIPFSKLVKQHKPSAVLIRQLGNPLEVCDFNVCQNILNSTTHPVPPHVNCVNYHPEFSLEDYSYAPPATNRVIKNFVNCLPKTVDAPLWYEYKDALPEFTFKMHGILGTDGLLPNREVPATMKEAAFIWHLKSQGDGYGFVVHQASALGRPCIVKKSYYAGQLAEVLFDDSVTCIDLDLGTRDENFKKIRVSSEPDNHAKLCENAYRVFKENVDFDREFEEIKSFLERAS